MTRTWTHKITQPFGKVWIGLYVFLHLRDNAVGANNTMISACFQNGLFTIAVPIVFLRPILPKENVVGGLRNCMPNKGLQDRGLVGQLALLVRFDRDKLNLGRRVRTDGMRSIGYYSVISTGFDLRALKDRA